MSEARAPNYDLAEQDYIAGMKYKDIAEKYNVTLNTVKSWKTRYKWSKENKKGVHTKTKKVCTQNKAVASEVESVMRNDNLTDKQRLFCLYFVKYRNKVKAYQKAYECSYTSACGNANKVWKNIEVQKEIQRLLDDFRSNIEVDITDLFQWYLDIARADINDFVMIKDNMIKVRNGSEIDGTLISEIKEGQFGVAVKLFDKQKAMSWISENIGIATDEQKVKIELIRAQIDNLNKDNDTGEGGVTIVNDIPRSSSNI